MSLRESWIDVVHRAAPERAALIGHYVIGIVLAISYEVQARYTLDDDSNRKEEKRADAHAHDRDQERVQVPASIHRSPEQRSTRVGEQPDRGDNQTDNLEGQPEGEEVDDCSDEKGGNSKPLTAGEPFTEKRGTEQGDGIRGKGENQAEGDRGQEGEGDELSALGQRVEHDSKDAQPQPFGRCQVRTLGLPEDYRSLLSASTHSSVTGVVLIETSTARVLSCIFEPKWRLSK